MDPSIFYQYNPWWENSFQPSAIIPRLELQKSCANATRQKAITFVAGLRRTGKTTLLKSTIQFLLNKNTPQRHIFYVSLDDYLLKNYNILEIIAEYRKLHALNPETKLFIFLDEIGYKQDFRQQLKNIYDQQNVKIFASTSSATALKDNSDFLTGRTNLIEVQPLNFEEFLSFRNIKIKHDSPNLKEHYFEAYLQTGGMPEYVLNPNREYLNTLVDDIILKDIVAFHNLRNGDILKDYFMLLMERAGKQISINKIAKILGISPDTSRRYLQYFIDTYLVYLVPRYGSTNEIIKSRKKIYAADLGISNIHTEFRDKGTAFENAIFIMIKSQEPKYVFQDGLEIDFITKDKTLIEVKYSKGIKDKQKELFDSFGAIRKLLISNVHDVDKLTALYKKTDNEHD